MRFDLKSKAVAVIAVFWSLAQLYNAITLDLDLLQLEVIHITCALMLVYLLRPGFKKFKYVFVFDYASVLLSLASGLYFFLSYERIVTRYRFVDPVLWTDFFFGSAIILLILEAGRRVMGLGLSVLAAVAIGYSFLGFLLPGELAHRSIDFANFMEFMVLTQEGVFGIPLRVSTTYVFLFILFGAFLKYGRLGELYNEFAMAIAGGLKGGPAKVAVISSSLLGTISGSAVANVSTSGSFTIPMMIRAGYSPVTAGAVESLASTGSQIIPPIMGAAAFIMAELTGISYWSIALAAIAPGLIYYVAVYSVVHYEAVRLELDATSSERPSMLKLITTKGYMFIPIVVIIYFLATGHSISMSAMTAIVACFIISAVPLVWKREWKEFGVFLQALEDGAKNCVNVAIPCAIAGIIVGVITLSALGLKFTGMILGISGGNMIIILILTSFICLILGMGMPTSAAYITVAVLGIPALIKAGLEPITAHFFGFYFANLSMITPPVALAAYAGAGIAKANASHVGLKACYLGLAIYIIPFLFATYPSLLLVGSFPRTVMEFLKVGIIIISFCTVYMGVFQRKISLLERFLFLAAAVLLWLGKVVMLFNLLGVVVFAAAALSNMREKLNLRRFV
ncbi:MAG: TRAP transporter fused permease subunit [Desulfobacteraceae bacterium]|nr:TRAP transporter fused permease subunit [Desulfobacteraceae bacterium]